VIAADADHDAVELLYRRPGRNRPTSRRWSSTSATRAAIEFLNAERPAALERMEADCVFALA
jgi:hypothetical protein